MDGLFINGERPKSKKAVKEAVAADPNSVEVENTSMLGNGGYSGPVSGMPDGTINFVGPNPYTRRNFYGTIRRTGSRITVS